MAKKYSLSFTACSLRLNSFTRLIKDVGAVEHQISMNYVNAEVLLNKGNEGSSKRELSELIKRYNNLTLNQKQLFLNSGLDERKQLAFLATCKTYQLLSDFVLEVLREKVLVYNHDILEGELLTFYNRKAELHPELEDFADSTRKKAFQHVWKILEEADMIHSTTTKTIKQPWLSEQMIRVVAEDKPENLKLFLLTDTDLKHAVK